MSENHTNYLKTPHVLKIINNADVTCEEKLDGIRNLIDGKRLKVLPPGQELSSRTPDVPVEPSSAPAQSPIQAAIDRIVNEISGVKEKQLATSLLNEIDRSGYISFDPETLEIIVNGENIKFSNIKNLVQYCISASPSQIPLAIALFLDCLIKIKIPPELLRHGDALGIRDSLLKIDEIKSKSLSSTENAPSVSETIAEGNPEVSGEKVSEEAVSSGRGTKRGLEEDDDDDDDEVPLNPAKKSYGLSDGSLNKIRTAPKLREQISSAWRDAMGGTKSRKRKVTLEYPEAEEEGGNEWNKEASPASRSKRKKVSVDFAAAEAEWGSSDRKKNKNQRE